MPLFKTGDRVKIVEREMTAADIKSGLFYDYFRNLIGSVEHIYEDKTICVQIDLDSLPEDVYKRHIALQETIRQGWLDGLGQEQRARLTEADSKLTLSYNVLVNAADLEPAGKAKPKPRPKLETSAKPEHTSFLKDSVERRTQEEIEKAEEEYLKALTERADSSKN